MSLRSVTVSAWSMSAPWASTSGTSDATRTRIDACGPTYACRTSTGSPFMVASMRRTRLGSAPKVLTW